VQGALATSPLTRRVRPSNPLEGVQRSCAARARRSRSGERRAVLRHGYSLWFEASDLGDGPSARSKERGRTFPRPAVLLRVREVAMMTRDAYKVPSWAIATLSGVGSLRWRAKESRQFDPASDRGVATANGRASRPGDESWGFTPEPPQERTHQWAWGCVRVKIYGGARPRRLSWTQIP
jgi:hypothetical protein